MDKIALGSVEKAKELLNRKGVLFAGIPNDHIDAVWPGVKQMLQSALPDLTDVKLEYVYDRLMLNQAMLWFVLRDGEVLMVCITEIIEQLGERKWRIAWGAGKDVELYLKDAIEAFEQYAFEARCTAIDLEGRLGWERFLKPLGFKRLAVVFEKDLTRGTLN